MVVETEAEIGLFVFIDGAATAVVGVSLVADVVVKAMVLIEPPVKVRVVHLCQQQ